MPGIYNFRITNDNGCYKIFKVIVEYIIIKTDKGDLFDSTHINSYSGSKTISNTPKGQ